MMNNRITGSIELQTLLSFGAGLLLLTIVLILPALFPMVQGTWPLNVALALAAAATAAAIPGFVNLLFGIRAKNGCVMTVAGGFVVFVVVLGGPVRPGVTKLAIEVVLLVLTWALIWYGAQKYELKISKTSLALVTIVILLSQIALFSQASGHDGDLLRLDDRVDVKQEVCLRGKWQEDQDGNRRCVGGNQKVWSPWYEYVRDVDCEPPRPEDALCTQIQFKVFWLKWEDWPAGDEESLSARSYTGHVLYELDERCEARLLDSSLKPGSKVPSWLVGFIEIPFLAADADLRRGVETFVQKQVDVCSEAGR